MELPPQKITSILERDKREASRTITLNLRIDETRAQFQISEKSTVSGLLEKKEMVSKLRKNFELLLKKAGLL